MLVQRRSYVTERPGEAADEDAAEDASASASRRWAIAGASPGARLGRIVDAHLTLRVEMTDAMTSRIAALATSAGGRALSLGLSG